MKSSKLLTLCAMSLMLSSTAITVMASDIKEKTPAFPGAEGFGRYVTGGRGGAVYHVTSLADDGSQGTFRWACNQKGKRTIVFDVSGTIYLQSSLSLNQGDVTIAGQSAPGYGICIADYPFSISANNVIVRYMRFRLGNNHVTQDGADGWDGLGGMDKEGIIIDHCSISWSIDECLSVYGVKNSTVQWCISSQSLQDAGHSKGAHGYGGNWGGSGVTYHHNLMAHHESRVPRLGPRYTTQNDERMDMRNNVFYNWAGNGCYGGEAMNVNIVNNYYKPGPGTAQISDVKQKRIAAIGIRTNSYIATYPAYAPTLHTWGKYFVSGNVNSKYADVTNDNWTYGMYNQIDANGCDGTYSSVTKDTIRINEPIEFVHVTTHSAEDAYNKVLNYAGCSKKRDSYDEFIINETRNGLAQYTGSGNHKGIIDTPYDNKPSGISGDWSPFPELGNDKISNDSDGDGIPDLWEENRGLNPDDPSDGAKIGADGYSNLEIYLNSLIVTITDGCTEGGEVLGIDKNEGEESVASVYELSPLTSNGGWEFSNGFTISTGKGYAAGSSCGISGIKYSRNEKFTINIPDGLAISKIEFTGYSNADGATAYLGELNGIIFSATDYVFPSRTSNITATHSIAFDKSATGFITFTPKDQQVVYIIKLHIDTSTGISNVVRNDNQVENIVYTLDGRKINSDVKTLSRGIYIINKKKVMIK